MEKIQPESLSIVNSESTAKEAIKNAYSATCSGVYTLYNQASSCYDKSLLEQIGEPGSLWKKQLGSDDADNMHYMLHKPSSDSTPQFLSLAKEPFGEKVEVQQCYNHLSGTYLFKFCSEIYCSIFRNLFKFIQNFCLWPFSDRMTQKIVLHLFLSRR